MTVIFRMIRVSRLALLYVAFLLAMPPGSSRCQEPSRHAGSAREQANQLGLLQGMVQVELIRPDMLSVTIDGGLVPGSSLKGSTGALGTTAEDLQQPDRFTVASAGAGTFQSGVRPVQVFRATYEWFNATDTVNTWPLVAAGPLLRHDYFLRLPRPLEPGHTYTVAVQSDAPAGMTTQLAFRRSGSTAATTTPRTSTPSPITCPRPPNCFRSTN